ncbi:MAG: cupin domain-containing protein [Candidatus Shapirobacteria bacterium]
MKLIKSESKEWLQKEGYSKKIYLNENDLNIKGGLVQKLLVKSGETAQEHHHEKQTEIFYFLNENGYFIVNGEKVEVKIDDVLVVEPFDIHTAVNKTGKDFSYMAFKFNYEESDLIWD